jgi:peroxiredoxin
LLSDTDMHVGEMYQVRRSPDEERANYPLRIAYLIDPEGTIRKAYEVTDTGGFASEVVRDLELLQGPRQ